MASERGRARASVAPRAGAAGRRAQVKRARVRWSEALGEEFLALVAETGNARAAAAALGAPHAFNNKMKRDPEFRRRARDAAAAADARLSGAERAFPADETGTADVGTRTADVGTRTFSGKGTCPQPIVPLRTDAAALGGFLRPGRKRVSATPQPVIRRNSQGRTQVTFARAGHWTAEIEADFLARVRASGNIAASARAVGFQPASVHERLRRWPAFKAAVDAALEEVSDELEYALVAHATALARGAAGDAGDEAAAGDAAIDGGAAAAVPRDPIGAMRILSFIDARRARRIGRARKGPPEKTLEEAIDSIMRKLDAIERHEKAFGQDGRSAGEEEGDGQ
ncbi:MAG: hypothetical protein JO013_07790 [Alphaproteobacteria bacterium]|nr:hypothetical protein [Alphaproteobacteria bacterium]